MWLMCASFPAIFAPVKTINCFILVSLLLLCGCSNRRQGPCAELAGPDRIDFGRYPAWEKRIAEFSIRNAGEETLDIVSIKKTCGCAVVTCSRKKVAPGEEALISVLIMPDSIFGKYDKPTFVETTDPARRVIPLYVSGNAVPLVEVRPSTYLYFGRINTNEEWRQRFTLNATSNGVHLGPLEIKCDVPVNVNLKSGADMEGRNELFVTLPPVTNARDFSCAIRVPILTPSNHPSVEIGIAGKIGAELVALPGIFRVQRSELEIKRHFTLRVVGRNANDVDVAMLEFPKCIGLGFSAGALSLTNNITVEMSGAAPFMDQLRKDGKITALICLPGVAPAKLVFESVETANAADQ
jgi:hypothetical protein